MSRIFGAVRQNGYVVRDLDAEVKHWVDDLGIGPWFYFSDIPLEDFKYFGTPGNPHIAVALANSGDLQIELIQPLDGEPSLYRDFLDAGREGLQHFAYWTTEYQELYDTALSLGYVVGHEGKIGGEKGRFAYLDTEKGHPGTVIEISDISGPKKAVFDFIKKSSLGWDGSKPIRPMG